MSDGLDALALAEIAPLLRRAIDLDHAAVVRIRLEPRSASALVRLPFGVLAGRRISGEFTRPHDASYLARELLGWLKDVDRRPDPPTVRDGSWRGAVPPESGWRRVEVVPDGVIRDLVRQGAATLKVAAEREGLPGAQLRAEVTDALLDSTVLTATLGDERVEIRLRSLSALLRLAFLAPDSHLAIDTAGRWIRLAGAYGSVYVEREGLALNLLGVRPNPHGGIGR